MLPPAPPTNTELGQTGKDLIFKLLGESYGIQVSAMREIVHRIVINLLDPVPGGRCGTISLRGKMIPVMDLCHRHSPDGFELDENYVTILQINQTGGPAVTFGLVMDDVEELANISPAEIEKPALLSGRFPADCIMGTARISSGVKALLNLDRLIRRRPLMDFCHAN